MSGPNATDSPEARPGVDWLGGDEETNIFLAALAANLELPTDVLLLSRGMNGLRYGMATVGECADRIIKDYMSGELAKRLAFKVPVSDGATKDL